MFLVASGCFVDEARINDPETWSRDNGQNAEPVAQVRSSNSGRCLALMSVVVNAITNKKKKITII